MAKLPNPKLYWKTILQALVIAFVVGLAVQWLSWKFGPSEGPFPAGTQISDFSLASIDSGKSMPFKELSKGKKVIVVNFWATWCGPCVAEMPSLVELQRKYASKGLQLLLVSMDENARDVVPLALTRFKIEFPTYFDEEQKLTDQFAVSALPKSYIFDGNGKVLDVVVGDRDWMGSEFLRMLDSWLS